VLSDEVIADYLKPLETQQVECIKLIRGMIVEICPTLTEEIDTGKWFGGMLTYYADGIFMYALGPRAGGKSTLHMMAYYMSSELHAKHGEAFKKILSGKSCILFKTIDELPVESIKDIFEGTPRFVVTMKEFMEARKKKKK